MKAVIQVVQDAELKVDGQLISKIGQGLVVYFGVEKEDAEEKLQYFAKKIANLRIFADNNGKTNLSVKDVGGEILLVSQFTLAARCEHGNRPDFFNAERPDRANELYKKLKDIIEKEYVLTVKMGVFGGDMKINQTNDGPFTVILEK